MAVARYATTSVVLALAALVWRPRLPRQATDLLLLGGLGRFGVFGYALALNYGELTLTASAARLVYNATPIFTALMALACVGVTIIAAAGSDGVRFTQGAWFVLLATFFQAIAFVITKRLLVRGWTPFELTAWSIWLGTAFLLPFGSGGVLALAGAALTNAARFRKGASDEVLGTATHPTNGLACPARGAFARPSGAGRRRRGG